MITVVGENGGPSADEIHRIIGTLLISTQAVEFTINHCLRLVIRFRQAPTIDEIYALNEPEKKKTLGNLLSELRERVSLDPSFDSLLESFLENRNTFAHRISFLPGWNLETESGREVAIKFLDRYAWELTQVRNLFLAFAREEDIRLGRKTPIPEGSESLFEVIDKQYVPIVPNLTEVNLESPKKSSKGRSKKK